MICQEIVEKENNIDQLNYELKIIIEQYERIKSIIIQEAQIIGATLTKTYLSDDIQKREFDTVIIDEVSMAALPALWCATCVAGKHLVIVGDFIQLPPVVISNNDKAKQRLGTNIFEESGIIEKLKKNEAPGNFITLDRQYRMDKDIADISNQFYHVYNRTTLKTELSPQWQSEQVDFNRWFYDDAYPWENDGHAVRVIDTENLNSWATGVPGSSRCNYFNAALDIELAFSLIKLREKSCTNNVAKKPLLIIAPYKPQVKLLDKMIKAKLKDEGFSEDDENLVQAGTVHSFQGRESDVVIFDLVIDEPHWKAMIFTPDYDDSNQKMFNVAISRSKFALFIIGNVKYCRTKGKKALIERALFEPLKRKDTPQYDAKELFPELTLVNGNVKKIDGDYHDNCIITNGEDYYNYLYKDISELEHTMEIYSPFMTESRISILLPYFDDAMKKKGRKIKIFTKAPSEWKKKEAASRKKCELILQKHGIQVVYKGSMHEKMVFIDENITYFGSLNTLSYNGETGEIMQRIKSKEYYNLLATNEDLKNLNLETNESDGIREGTPYCPICDSAMVAKENSKGCIYWICENDELSWNPNSPFPVDGVFRCELCGSELEFQMKEQPRWVCPQHKKKYRRVHWNELKLPAMRNKIPAIDLERVITYFHKTKKEYIKEIQSMSNEEKNKKEETQIEMHL